MNVEQKNRIKMLNAKFVNKLYLGITKAEDLKKEYLDVLKTIIDWNNIDREDCKLLGFGRWTDEDTELKNLFLIPYYLHSIIPIGLKVCAIDGKWCEWENGFDTDVRFGMLAYGVMVEK